MNFNPKTKECSYSGHNLDVKNMTVDKILTNISCSKHGSAIKAEQDKKASSDAKSSNKNFKIVFFIIEVIAVILVLVTVYKKRKLAASEELLNNDSAR